MKKIIVSLLFIGSCLITKAQTDVCKINYFSLLNVDSVYSIYGESDESYLFFSNNIFQRYQNKLLSLYETDQLFIHFAGDSWFEVSRFHIESPKYGTVYFSTCEMEELFK